MNKGNENPAASGERAEAAVGVPEKRPWSKPEIRMSDGILWTQGGPLLYDFEHTNYYIPS